MSENISDQKIYNLYRALDNFFENSLEKLDEHIRHAIEMGRVLPSDNGTLMVTIAPVSQDPSNSESFILFLNIEQCVDYKHRQFSRQQMKDFGFEQPTKDEICLVKLKESDTINRRTREVSLVEDMRITVGTNNSSIGFTYQHTTDTIRRRELALIKHIEKLLKENPFNG